MFWTRQRHVVDALPVTPRLRPNRYLAASGAERLFSGRYQELLFHEVREVVDESPHLVDCVALYSVHCVCVDVVVCNNVVWVYRLCACDKGSCQFFEEPGSSFASCLRLFGGVWCCHHFGT